MSDDLVKRLRHPVGGMRPTISDGRAAADRIEELEAKLAMAVEALRFYGKLIGEKQECPWHMLSDDFGEKARTTLAELTGGKDE